MVARVVPQSARRRHAESRKPDLRGVVAGGRWPVLASAVFMRNSRSIVRAKHDYYYFLFSRAHLAPPHRRFSAAAAGAR